MTSRSSPQNQTSDGPTFCLHFSTGEIDSDYCERQTASSANGRYHTKNDPDQSDILELFARANSEGDGVEQVPFASFNCCIIRVRRRRSEVGDILWTS